jgi:hypothetical protein
LICFLVAMPAGRDPIHGKSVKMMADQTISILLIRCVMVNSKPYCCSDTAWMAGCFDCFSLPRLECFDIRRKAWSTCLAAGSWFVVEE